MLSSKRTKKVPKGPWGKRDVVTKGKEEKLSSTGRSRSGGGGRALRGGAPWCRPRHSTGSAFTLLPTHKDARPPRRGLVHGQLLSCSQWLGGHGSWVHRISDPQGPRTGSMAGTGRHAAPCSARRTPGESCGRGGK